MIQNRMVTVMSLAGGLAALVIAIVLWNPLFAALAALFFSASLLVWKYGYLLIPYITKAGRIVEIRGGYEIPPTRDCIIKKSGNGFYATKFLEIRYYESTVDKTNQDRSSMLSAFEKALASLKNTVKISLLVSEVDLTREIDEIKTRRSSAENKRRKLPANSEELIRLDREIAMYNRQLERITHGDRPLVLTSFVSTTAYGVTREEALSKVRRQAKEVKTIISSTLGADVADLFDLDMIRCFEWEFFLPPEVEQLKDEVF
ncbi:MAG TPA: hypothetical protein PKJ97_01230 [Candidatus Bilamarchaeaceae archaeon]|nr:hypothetical protein [Candidatus Bilamarchaeaceae archaeon]